MKTPPIRIRIFYPADPLGVVPGGIDTFLRGLIKWAPDDLEFSLVGMTTDTSQRPLGRWTRCRIGTRSFDFFPLVATADAGQRGRIPLSLRYSLAARRYRAEIGSGFDVFDFHRIEPSLLFSADGRPKNTTFHNDPQTLRLDASDNIWRHAPRTYERLERLAMQSVSTAWCVRETGVQVLRERYAAQAEQIRFLPTWVDHDVFSPVPEQRRATLRRAKGHAHGLSTDQKWVVSVGRLDTQKDPALMLRSLVRLRREGRRPLWLVIGDGVLRPALQRQVHAWGLRAQVHFLGLLPPSEVAEWLRAADVFALTSAYEGMPMALLEALGCGLPAVTTDVGEVRRVVTPGLNGAIAAARSSRAYAAALALVLDDSEALGGAPALAAVSAYRPQDVLVPVYDNHRRLGAPLRDLRLSSAAAQRLQPAGMRACAVGVPLDLLDRDAAHRQLLDWAREKQSRYACFVNVHSSVHASRDERHRLALLGADLAVADGAPIAWTVGVKAGASQDRIDGPGTMWRLCEEAADRGIAVGLYGGSPAALRALAGKLNQALPHLRVPYAWSPPFRELRADEDAVVCADIASAGVGLLFVGLGCPKQEHWMAVHRGRIPAVMLGVGAAFDFHAGTALRAPAWMRQRGLEWLHRMGTNPRRLGGRYLQTNTVFLARTAREVSHELASRSARRRAATGLPRQQQQPPQHQQHHPRQHTQQQQQRQSQPSQQREQLPPRHPESAADAVDAPGPISRAGLSARAVHSTTAGATGPALAANTAVEARDGDMPSTVFQPSPYEMRIDDSVDMRPFENLVTRVDTHLQSSRGRLIGFIASGGGEGTSRVARAYVAAAAARLPRRVLLLQTEPEGWGSGVMQALAAQRPLHMLLRPLDGGGVVASLGGADAQRAVSELATRTELWEELRRHFDDIVIDLPASCASAMGLALAPFCDGVVVVLEAGKTRAPVVQGLVADLRAVQARVLGTVMNKRRFLVPEPVYRWL